MDTILDLLPAAWALLLYIVEHRRRLRWQDLAEAQSKNLDKLSRQLLAEQRLVNHYLNKNGQVR